MWLVLLALVASVTGQENSLIFRVEEGVPIGTSIGEIGSQGPYLIVPLEGQSSPEEDLIVNQRNGEIRTRKILDRETKDKYLFSAIPLNGESIKVTVLIQDINDNAPNFDLQEFKIDIPENIPFGTKRKLPPALDKDQDGVTKYEIVSGNVGQAFQVAYNDNNALDLVVQGQLDRERLDRYTMVLVASDNGQPPKSTSLTLKVQVQDLNDSPPIFSKQR